jgi:hypothetical protein
MNVRITYSDSGNQYSEHLINFDVKVSRSSNGRIKVSFKQKDGNGRGYATFSLPRDKSRQLAHAILVQTSSEGAEPVQFSVEESPSKAVAA